MDDLGDNVCPKIRRVSFLSVLTVHELDLDFDYFDFDFLS